MSSSSIEFQWISNSQVKVANIKHRRRVYTGSPTNTQIRVILCGLLLSNTSLIRLADYRSRDPPSAWTTGSDRTNGSGATPSDRSHGSSSSLVFCVSVSENVYQGNTTMHQGLLFIYMVAWEQWKTPTAENQWRLVDNWRFVFFLRVVCSAHNNVFWATYKPTLYLCCSLK